MKISTLLFDLDGTLLDTADDLCVAVNHALEVCGFPNRDVSGVRMFLGNGIKRLMELSVPAGTSEDDTLRALALFRAYYAEHASVLTRPYDGILSSLSALHQDGYKMAVISNKFDAAVKALNTKFFSEYIPVAIGDSEGSGLPKKPAPDMLYAAMDALGVKKEECLYIGDSEVDILTAANTGIPCIGCAWGLRGRARLEAEGLAAEMILDDAKDLYKFIASLKKSG